MSASASASATATESAFSRPFSAILAVRSGLAERVFLSLPLAAFAGAMAAVLAVYLLAHASGRPSLHGLLLTGLAVSALAGAGFIAGKRTRTLAWPGSASTVTSMSPSSAQVARACSRTEASTATVCSRSTLT